MALKSWWLMQIKTGFAWGGIIIISLIPAILLLANSSTTSQAAIFTLGRIAGLIGMTMFALTLVLSTRAGWLEDLFDGQDKVYHAHGVLGATSLILILAHPILLVLKFIPNYPLASRYLLPGGILSVDYGIFALAGMIALIMLTLYSRWKYNNWKISHEFLGLVFVFASLHVFLVRDTVAVDNIFSGYSAYAAAVTIIGLAAFGYSTIARRWLKTGKYKIDAINKIGESYEIILSPLVKGLKFKAGQFVFVKFHNQKTGRESHPFSLACASGNGEIRIIAKKLGDFTAKLGELKQGDNVIVEGPYGRFHIKPGFADEVWVAGGIGITPFLGLVQDFKQYEGRNVSLFYTVRDKAEFVHLDELQAVAETNKRFKLYIWITAEHGYLTLAEIEKQIDIAGRKFYLCGPQSLKASIEEALRKKGIKDIHHERFAFK
jgi:predicted ferric reductase